VALTFDDGPNPPRTDEVLAVLGSRKARATFFVIGKWVERWPGAFERIVQAGHVIGNHSYLHNRDLGDFDRAEPLITNLAGRPTAFLRAPYFFSRLYLNSQVATLPTVKAVHADVVPDDWSLTDPNQISSRILNSASLQGGSIIDLHDGSESECDAERMARPAAMILALPKLIDELRVRGYTLVGLDEMELIEPTQPQRVAHSLVLQILCPTYSFSRQHA
jgi:peptidoglycan/xylan/chitin deacetylase (PgdA/CDA1 family)